jgi:phosphoribosyl-ATP pyrophosphohydrolase/phosphoribosyl-AMP cyclohydrolase
MELDLDGLRFDERGLMPAVVQDAVTGQVLMLAYMNRLALEKTLETGLAHYWSRSRAALWQKGETSGHFQRVRDIRYDCDADALLLLVEQVGVACHTGSRSCFFRRLSEDLPAAEAPVAETLLHTIYEVILERRGRAPQESYVASLMARGQDQVVKKVVEEAAEVALASKNGRPEEILYEVADLWFHSLVVLGWHHLPPQGVLQELRRRFGKTGLRTQREPPTDEPSRQKA